MASSKPVKYLRKYVNGAGGNTRMTTRVATVTALRYDGTVNIRMNGDRYQGVPTMAEYDPRSVGDKVRVLFQNSGNPLVLGKLASDDLTAQPTIFPYEVASWTWGVDGGASDKYVSGRLSVVGRQSEQFPTTAGDHYLRMGIGYWNGSANLMNGPADLEKNIDIYLERDEWDDGYEGGSRFSLFPIRNDQLPKDPSPGSLNYQTSLGPSSVDFTLEPGELKVVTLPEEWRNSIGAVTLDSTSIRGFIIEPQSTSVSPEDVNSHTYGKFTPLTGALRMYT